MNAVDVEPKHQHRTFFTRYTDTLFLLVGVYTALTSDGETRYFSWKDGRWDPIDDELFGYYRDDDDTSFAEVSAQKIDEVKPGATATPLPDASQVAEQKLDEFRDPDDGVTELDAIIQHGKASAIAAIAHRGQVDKIGYSYIDHPARVAARFDWVDRPIEHCAAWLHDVLENSDITTANLLDAGVLRQVVETVEVLTRRAEVSDEQYYERVRLNPVALAVKLAALDDNTAGWRFRHLDHETQMRYAREYSTARLALGLYDVEEVEEID